MLNVFLQTGFEDLSTALGLGTIIFAAATVAGLWITIWQARESRYLDFIKDMDKRFAEQIEKEKELNDHDQCIVYAYNYVDICEQVMFLIEKRKIPRDFFEYYLDFFNYAITMMWWYASVYPEDNHSLKFSWQTMTKWIVKKERTPYPIMHLPKAMQNELTKKNILISDKEIYKQIKDRLI